MFYHLLVAYSPSERRAMAHALTRAADRVGEAATRAQHSHRGKGTIEKTDRWVEVRTLKEVEARLREWAVACNDPRQTQVVVSGGR